MIQTDFPEEVKKQLLEVQNATNSNKSAVTAVLNTLTADDYRKAVEVVKMTPAKYDTLSTVAGLTSSPAAKETFFSKYKYFIIAGAIVIVLVIGIVIYKKKG